MSDPDKDALINMIDRAVDGVDKSQGNCVAHGPLAYAVIVLLQCQKAQIKQRTESTILGAVSGSAAGAVLFGIIETVKALG